LPLFSPTRCTMRMFPGHTDRPNTTDSLKAVSITMANRETCASETKLTALPCPIDSPRAWSTILIWDLPRSEHRNQCSSWLKNFGRRTEIKHAKRTGHEGKKRISFAIVRKCAHNLQGLTIQPLFLVLVCSNTYVNHWERSSRMVSVEDPSLVGGGSVLKQHIWNAARDTIQEVILYSCEM
jgi:hypothetical protein